MDIQDVIADIEEYAETAGFAGYYNRVLKNMNEREIIKHYEEIFGHAPEVDGVEGKIRDDEERFMDDKENI